MTETSTTREVKTATKSKPDSKPLPPYHVVLLDDNDHSVEYVMVMLRELFGHPHEAGYKLATQVDRQGRAIVLTTHKERAELKCDQIHAYGPDHAVATCKGSMSAMIVPAEE
jgi:ATP-dependent Clp protease adaptor protein ClpS